MTLKDKIQIVLNKYNGGASNMYSKLMVNMIDDYYNHVDNFVISEEYIRDSVIYYSINELIGTCIRHKNPDLFKSESKKVLITINCKYKIQKKPKDTYLEITEHCPH